MAWKSAIPFLKRPMFRILLTGRNGQVGWDLQRTLAILGEVIAVDKSGLDLAQPDSIRAVIREFKPDWIVNAAAYTAVDKAESEPELAMAVNGVAPGILAEEAKRINATLIHYSTDYVFDGAKDSPYTENDAPNPLSVYGKTKLAGERAIRQIGAAHLILRTSWVYSMRGHNFLLTMLRLARERDELKVVDDQVGAPTWSRMIAQATAQIIGQLQSPDARQALLGKEAGETYHLTAAGQTSWYRFTRAILDQAVPHKIAAPPKLLPITTDQYLTSAPRPKNSRLANRKFMERFGISLPAWEGSLRLCMQEASTTSLPEESRGACGFVKRY